MKKNFLIIALLLLGLATLPSCGNYGRENKLTHKDTIDIIRWYKNDKSFKMDMIAESKKRHEQKSKSLFIPDTAHHLVTAFGIPAKPFIIDPQGEKIDTVQANKQLHSFLKLYGTGYIKSFYFNVDPIIDYAFNGAEYIKVMMAHSYPYVLGQTTEQFSLVISGIDQDGNYIILDGLDLPNPDSHVKYVYNNVAPCPYTCGDPAKHMYNDIISNQ
jgi:hypothetical protein